LISNFGKAKGEWDQKKRHIQANKREGHGKKEFGNLVLLGGGTSQPSWGSKEKRLTRPENSWSEIGREQLLKTAGGFAKEKGETTRGSSPGKGGSIWGKLKKIGGGGKGEMESDLKQRNSTGGGKGQKKGAGWTRSGQIGEKTGFLHRPASPIAKPLGLGDRKKKTVVGTDELIKGSDQGLKSKKCVDKAN